MAFLMSKHCWIGIHYNRVILDCNEDSMKIKNEYASLPKTILEFILLFLLVLIQLSYQIWILQQWITGLQKKIEPGNKAFAKAIMMKGSLFHDYFYSFITTLAKPEQDPYV